MIKNRRRNYQLGGSKALTYPSDVAVGDEATLAGNRLLIVDPRGEIDEADLMEFMENYVEPTFWKWWRQKEASKRASIQGVIKPMQAGIPTAEEAQPVEMRNVNPGPQVYLVNCWRCGGQIAWRLDLGPRGGCPYCGAWLQLVSK
jgi:hypothetical protein